MMRTKLFLLAALLGVTTIPAFACDDATLSAGASTICQLRAHDLQSAGIDVAASAKLLTVTLAPTAGNADVDLFLRYGSDFHLSGTVSFDDILAQSDYYSAGSGGQESISVADWSTRALRAGTWYALAVNTTGGSVDARMGSQSFTSNAPDTQFVINFDAPPQALIDAYGGADNLECDTAPWHDPDKGAFRRQLLQDAAVKLGQQVHSPVPVHVQACWKDFDDSGEHAGSYTLAAAGPVYFFTNENSPAAPVLPRDNTWYAQAPATRQAGTSLCHLDPSTPCDFPDIVVWYNSNDMAAGNYDDPSDEPLIRTVTIHELTHGLGFLGLANTGDNDDDTSNDQPIGMLLQNRPDAYDAQVVYVHDNQVESFDQLSNDGRKQAMLSGTQLRWDDPATTNSSNNPRRGETAPDNLVQLYAHTGTIQPGSTLSHLNSLYHGELMLPIISAQLPQDLGLAAPMLAQMGWNTQPLSDDIPEMPPPAPGNWYDPAHSGHGIDLEPAARNADTGDTYFVVFYTFDDSGTPEFYLADGKLQFGKFVPFTDTNGNTLSRPLYTGSGTVADPDSSGDVSIDFTDAAKEAPTCSGRTGEVALMHWEIDGQSGDWCIQPALAEADHPPASRDVNGHWYAGGADSGWGTTVVEKNNASGGPFLQTFLYYYDVDGQPRWSSAATSSYEPGETLDLLYPDNGYCRTCAKQTLQYVQVGTISLHLTTPSNSPSPDNFTTYAADDADRGLSFDRTHSPLVLLSLPPGQ